ncbi:hypothetical protein [Flavobacterium sp. FlaQc-48]|uniref:hypothetical protein n=1 Tax=Flavobacterium sp. FlaQc-48 TaxID=3374181 RepID=UPI0037574C92
MKTIKQTNLFALALPFTILLSYPFLKEGALIFSLLSTMVTGFLQFCIGVRMLTENPGDKSLQKYMAGVVIFFALWYINSQIEYSKTLFHIIFSIPLVLAIYLTVIIYKKP